MELSIFIEQLFSMPVLIIVVILVVGLMLVNGMTDAPNAIATCISTRAIKPKKAIAMAAICDALGIIIMSFISSNVASTIANMVDFGNNYNQALIALCSGIVGAILWALFATKFGIPSSESHALIAGISGAAIAIKNDLSRN